MDELQALDPLGYFAQPVDDEAIPEYRTVIPDPMDFSTMRVRLRRGEYSSPLQLADDFVLLCRNALVFNPSATNPYR
uniref:Bromo domain-containing protein n=1 Tax=Emiliania huxleyi (strain CCMP1516) TaxID=280463 RepID=A0A0D3KNP6_EMIH1